jgi:hypothetical protein
MITKKVNYKKQENQLKVIKRSMEDKNLHIECRVNKNLLFIKGAILNQPVLVRYYI